ncbi:MAG: endonuclease [bacterium (Candidatus Ratteibacteria) CG_4_10_14_3_um_filter_41_18]|uniref:Endonuclease n=1 Tax=bacterium (Candidatus Ratteibacteria) CG_4_10_14_3_um_filter_41_18 TaxID=2014287 RepID=A0A2M7M3D3_9BACT|nr:MAG: endonuclease [bacterium (Candidatus Ratteibacteria) CG_4_10_14_3_um_filter_41_18]
MYWLYILRSLKDGRVYIGSTNNLKRRLKEHERGKVKSTKGRRPFKLIHIEKFNTRSETTQRELFLKSPQGYSEKIGLIRSQDGV